MLKRFKIFCLVFCLILIFPLLGQSQEGASLYITPSSGTYFIGSTFNVSVYINTGGKDINAVQVELQFPPDKLQVASPTTGKSFISVWVSQPTYSNTRGTASFVGGLPSPGINTSSGLVSTITFRVKAPGTATISFKDTSQILLDDGNGTNVLSSISGAKYELVIPPPEGPLVSSPTHPDQNKWYQDNNPAFNWGKAGDVTDFSYSLDKNAIGVLDNSSEGDVTTVSYNDLSDGLWYFHVKSKRAGSWGGPTHFPVHIDKTPPAKFKPEVEPSKRTSNRSPLISFITTDALSGIDHYEIKIVSLDKESESTAFFTEQVSSYRIPSQELGSYNIVVRAYDRAGNYQDETVKIKIVLPGEEEGFFGIIETFFIGRTSIFYSVIILVLFFLLLFPVIVYVDRKQSRARLRKEIKDVREALDKGTEFFEENVEEKLKELEKLDSGTGLTREQKREKEDLLDDLSDLNKRLQKEVKDVEDQLKK